VIILMGVTTTVFGQWGFGTILPNAAAVVDVYSTTRGFLLPRMTDAQMAAIPSPAEGLMVYNITQHCLAVYSSGAFTCAYYTPPGTCGSPISVIHNAGPVAPATITITYGTVSTGVGGTGVKCWITQNLGATQQASSYTDFSDASAGWYWQFNRMQGFSMSGTTRTPSTAWLTPYATPSDWAPANDPCTLLLGAGWRLPTLQEWDNTHLAPNNWTSAALAYAGVLKLHEAGSLDYNTGLLTRSGAGYWWSSTTAGGSSGNTVWETGSVGGPSSYSWYSSYGFSVRCLRDY